MSKVAFTDEQREAIETLDRSILVSAAAGSGKTAVLIERIINIIISGRANVDEMLVVTFTNAAAAEMKVKLTKAIRKEMREHPERSELLSRQLDLLYRSYISTFHSFALRIIKEFFYKIDFEPNFSISDDANAVLLQMEAMDDLFDECFADDDLIPGGSFRDFLRHYSDERSESRIIEELISTYGKLRSMPDYFNWAENKAEMLKMPEGGYRDSKVFRMLGDTVCSELDKAASEIDEAMDMLDEHGLSDMADALTPEKERVDGYRRTAAAGEIDEEFFAAIGNAAFATLRAKKAEKEAYDPIKENIKAIRGSYKDRVRKLSAKYAEPSLEERFREMDETYRYTRYYLSLLRGFEKKYDQKKRDQSLIDFGDIEHIAEKILDDPEVAETLRMRFKFVFIDEYQDTNCLQEDMISKIARNDNVFKVGDVKQSIYRFRQSEPKIFEDTYRSYGDASNTDATVINLNRNFRSNGGTIAYINDVFADIMDGYDDDAKLYKGLPGNEDYDFKPEVHALIEDAMTEDAEDDGTGDEIEVQDDDGEEFDRTKAEAEAEHVADTVAGLIGTEFFDSKSGVVRKAEPRDIVILMRSTKYKSEIYYKAMIERGVTAHVSDDDGYFNTVEINVAMSLLEVIDNMKRDIPLLTVLHSEIFGFSPEELGTMRAEYSEVEGRGTYHDAFMYYIENGGDEELAAKARSARDTILRWRSEASSMQLDDYIWHVLTDSNYYLLAGSMYGGRQRQANLRALTDRALAYRKSGIASLGLFIRYLGILKKQKIKTGQAMMVSEEDNIVRIMTIHKSKGLEFPFVIIAGLGGRLNYEKNSRGFMFDSQLGVGLSYVDKEKKFWRSTILQRMMTDKIHEDEYREELRVLYVAMTRAREKLILVGTVRNEDKLDNGMTGRGSFFDMIGNVMNIPSDSMNIYPLERSGRIRTGTGLSDFMEKRKIMGDVTGTPLYEEVDRRLGYEYPDSEALRVKAKYSVSEIRQAAEGDEAAKKKAGFAVRSLSEDGGSRAAETGTAYHRVMEYLDFGKAVGENGACDDEYIAVRAAELADRGAIPEDVYSRVDLGKIAGFFHSDTGRRAAAATRAGAALKEKPFTLRTEYNGRQVLVQGIIDCLFREPDGIVLIDYKTSRVRAGASIEAEKERIAAEYATQIDIYREAIEAGTGEKVKEAYLYLFDIAEVVKM